MILTQRCLRFFTADFAHWLSFTGTGLAYGWIRVTSRATTVGVDPVATTTSVCGGGFSISSQSPRRFVGENRPIYSGGCDRFLRCFLASSPNPRLHGFVILNRANGWATPLTTLSSRSSHVLVLGS